MFIVVGLHGDSVLNWIWRPSPPLFVQLKSTTVSFLFFIKKGQSNIPVESHNINKGQLGPYLAGLIESDGHIITPSGSVNQPTIGISFHSNDLPLANHIMKILGYGSIQPTISNSAFVYIIRSQQGILDIVNLINGYFRTPKISALHSLIDWINLHPAYLKANSVIIKLPLDITPLATNSWLAGFSVLFFIKKRKRVMRLLLLELLKVFIII